MNTNFQISGRNLFGEQSFSKAIKNKNVEEVANIIRKACYDYHFEVFFDTPICKALKDVSPDLLEKRKNKSIENFEQDIQILAEIIIESEFASLSGNDSDIEPLISAIRDQTGNVARFYCWIGGPRGPKRRYDHSEFAGLSEDEVEFFKLARRGDTNSIEAMIINGVNPHAKTEERTTALMIAVEYGQRDAAEMLLKWKTDVHAREWIDDELAGKGLTAMNIAALNKDFKMIELLLQYGGDINEKAGFDGNSPFLIAVESGDYDYMDFVLQNGADVNIELFNGKTALVYAVFTADKKLANYLLEKGADINHRNITGLTALDVAKVHGFADMANFLIESGAIDDHRVLEHLVTYRQDFHDCDNGFVYSYYSGYAYYTWSTDDGFSHFLICDIGPFDNDLNSCELRRFYIRKKNDHWIETYAGNQYEWCHYVKKCCGQIVDERLNSYGRNLDEWGELSIDPERVYESPDVENRLEPPQSEEFDLEGKYKELSEFFLKFVSLEQQNNEAIVSPRNITSTFSKYSKKGFDFMGPYWEWVSVYVNGPCLERSSANVKGEHQSMITDFITTYFSC